VAKSRLRLQQSELIVSEIVNGSSLQPLSGGRPKQIVLLLHGYGSNGADLISLAPHWQRELPDALFLAPNAPQRLGSLSGYQWWPLTAFTPQVQRAQLVLTSPATSSKNRHIISKHQWFRPAGVSRRVCRQVPNFRDARVYCWRSNIEARKRLTYARLRRSRRPSEHQKYR
jgi:hypothetical protein